MKPLFLFLSILFTVGYSSYAQTKKATAKPIVKAPLNISEIQKAKIKKINEAFRTNVQQTAAAEKDPRLKINKIQALRERRDSSILALLGEQQYNQFRQAQSPNNAQNLDKFKVKQESSKLKHRLRLTDLQMTKVEKLEETYLQERRMIIGAGKDSISVANKLDSLKRSKNENLRLVFSNEQYDVYSRNGGM